MKKFTYVIITMILLSVSLYSAPMKRVLLEQHTGAWCGWCVDGSYIMDQLIEQYPDQVIGVKIHNGDKMVIPEQSVLAQAMGLGGYPTGSVDRNAFNVGGQGTIFLDRGAWKQASEIMMQQAPKVEVTLLYSYNPSSKTLIADISCEILQTVTEDLRFNVYICEDNVSGSGTGWNQSNYLAGRAGYENNPYYTQPGTIIGYQHMKVVRKMLGGAWGTENVITAGAAAGSKFSYSYTTQIDAGWKWDDIFLVGLVQSYSTSSRLVLNSVYGKEGTPSSELTVSGSVQSIKPAGEGFVKNFNLKNITNDEITFKVDVTKSTRTPADWTYDLQVPSGIAKSDNPQAGFEFKLTAGQTAQLTLTMTPGATVGIGDANMTISNKYDPAGQKSAGMITVISEETTSLEIFDDTKPGSSILTQMKSGGMNTAFNISSDEFDVLGSSLTNLKTLVWNCGTEGNISSGEGNNISDAIADGKNAFIIGAVMGETINTNSQSLLSYLGISFVRYCYQGMSTQGAVYFDGVLGDPITDGYSQAAKITYLAPYMKATNPNTYPILKFKGTDSTFAFRSQVKDSRVVFMGTDPFYITNTYGRDNLLEKCLAWIGGAGSSIEVANELTFEDTEVGQTSEMTIIVENKGQADLVVSDVEIDYEYQMNFKVKDATGFVVPPMGSYDLIIQFTPGDAITYDTWMKIKSNAQNIPDKQISLVGKGKAPVPGATLEINKSSVNFTDTFIDQTSEQTLEISNTGNETLNVTNITVPAKYAAVFVFDRTSFSVEPDSKSNVKITFQPKEEGSIATNMTITSNAKNNPNVLPLNASAVLDVEDNINLPSIFSLQAGPNPFNMNTNIEFILNGQNNMEVNIIAIDATGRTVKEIANKNFAPGTVKFNFDGSGLASGTYHIVAKAKDFSTQIPVVIVK